MQQKPAAQKKVFKRECADEIVSFMSAIPISRLPDDKLHVICFLPLRLFGLRRQSAMVLLSVPKCTRREAHRQAIAGGHDPNGGGEMGDRVHQGCSSGSAFGRGHPNRAPTVFWTSSAETDGGGRDLPGVLGKGRKERCLPLWKDTAADPRAWLAARDPGAAFRA
jgi:integrase